MSDPGRREDAVYNRYFDGMAGGEILAGGGANLAVRMHQRDLQFYNYSNISMKMQSDQRNTVSPPDFWYAHIVALNRCNDQRHL